jgi:hypothetical protein
MVCHHDMSRAPRQTPATISLTPGLTFHDFCAAWWIGALQSASAAMPRIPENGDLPKFPPEVVMSAVIRTLTITSLDRVMSQ